jgi:(S)-mandelate dehydrogenase
MSRGDTLNAYNVHDLRDRAKRFLPRGVFEYVERGTEDELAMDNNRAAFERVKLIPRVLRDVTRIDQSLELFGRKMSMPVAVGATGAAGFVWFNGDTALARAAKEADIPFTISSASTLSLETIAQVGGRLWFQLYPWENRPLTYELVKRAATVDCEALIVTVDTPVSPNREYNARNGFALPLRPNLHNVIDTLCHPRWAIKMLLRHALVNGFATQPNLPVELRGKLSDMPTVGSRFACDNLTWDEIKHLRDLWRGRMMIKGMVSPIDAALAADAGMDAVIVSNHGGRNLDSVVATMDILPDVLTAVNGRIPVLMDSGIRRGSDVVKALALGAKAVLVGRLPLYGLAAGGQLGVQRALQLLREETARTMALCGCRSIAEINHDLIYRAK